MRYPFALALALLPAAALSAPQTASQGTAPPVVPVPARIDVRAAGPLPEVLERISRQTGMKVTYEGGTPRTRVTTNLTGVTPAQAVVSVMEGLDLNYLMGLDAGSNRVETLLVVSRSGSGTRAAPARSGASSARMPISDDAMPEEDEPVEDPMAGAIIEAMPGDPNDPMGLAGQPPPGSGPGANQNIAPGRAGGDPKDTVPPAPEAPSSLGTIPSGFQPFAPPLPPTFGGVAPAEPQATPPGTPAPAPPATGATPPPTQ